jgi:hypothetical protein
MMLPFSLSLCLSYRLFSQKKTNATLRNTLKIGTKQKNSHKKNMATTTPPLIILHGEIKRSQIENTLLSPQWLNKVINYKFTHFRLYPLSTPCTILPGTQTALVQCLIDVGKMGDAFEKFWSLLRVYQRVDLLKDALIGLGIAIEAANEPQYDLSRSNLVAVIMAAQNAIFVEMWDNITTLERIDLHGMKDAGRLRDAADHLLTLAETKGFKQQLVNKLINLQYLHPSNNNSGKQPEAPPELRSSPELRSPELRSSERRSESHSSRHTIKCPSKLVTVPLEDNESDANACVICQSNRKAYMVRGADDEQCGHVVACGECVEKLYKGKEVADTHTCPMCRVVVEEVIRAHF